VFKYKCVKNVLKNIQNGDQIQKMHFFAHVKKICNILCPNTLSSVSIVHWRTQADQYRVIWKKRAAVEW